jgi:hypothetical protein
MDMCRVIKSSIVQEARPAVGCLRESRTLLPHSSLREIGANDRPAVEARDKAQAVPQKRKMKSETGVLAANLLPELRE